MQNQNIRFVAEYQPFGEKGKKRVALNAEHIFNAVDVLLSIDAVDFERTRIFDLHEGKVYTLPVLLVLQSDFRDLCEANPAGMARAAEIPVWN